MVSVAEHVVMLILSLVRNYLPAHKQITEGGWDIGAAAATAYDLENKVVGTVGTGRIGQLVLARLKVSPPALATFLLIRVAQARRSYCGSGGEVRNSGQGAGLVGIPLLYVITYLNCLACMW